MSGSPLYAPYEAEYFSYTTFNTQKILSLTLARVRAFLTDRGFLSSPASDSGDSPLRELAARLICQIRPRSLHRVGILIKLIQHSDSLT
ncbi:unnamed protein product [Leptosia nina]|uniref:Maturase K n=1 Tax=Leptosia nina TaxID=320188 RepID=A0AAV1JDQ8_9NEOP